MNKNLLISALALTLAAGCSHKPAAPAATDNGNGHATHGKGTPKAAPAKAAQKLSSADGRVCRHGQEERRLEVLSKNPGCVLRYTKGGETREMASAEHETQYCEKVLQKMAGHLENAGFRCE